MEDNRSFRTLSTRHVGSEDDVHIAFIDANQLTYGKPDRDVVQESELYMTCDDAPDGQVAPSGQVWSGAMICLPGKLHRGSPGTICWPHPCRCEARCGSGPASFDRIHNAEAGPPQER